MIGPIVRGRVSRVPSPPATRWANTKRTPVGLFRLSAGRLDIRNMILGLDCMECTRLRHIDDSVVWLL